MRGDIYRFRPNHPGPRGHEQIGPRYGVIVQATHLILSTVVIVPTSTSARETSFRPPIMLDGVRTLLLPEQIGAVDTDRLGDFAGRLEPEELAALDRAIALVLH